MNKAIIIVFVLYISNTFSQKDSIKISSKYLEDQLYISVSYNRLTNQPDGIKDSGFSYGISTGFIKDIPLNKKRNLGIGLGLGYGIDSYNHGLKITHNDNQYTYEEGNSLLNNKLITHNIEIPFEIRWRNSTLKRYAFWRIYAGIKMSYNFSNTFSYTDISNFEFNNVSQYNKWQTGITVSAGYDAFNLYMYYGLTSLFKNATISPSTTINTKVIKFGLIFYIL